MSQKPRKLDNVDPVGAHESGWVVDKGDPGVWECVAKAHFDGGDSEPYAMKSTKRMKVPGGWLYNVSTELRDYIGGYVSCAEALTFVPDPPPTSRV